jgi:hypothetical protein
MILVVAVGRPGGELLTDQISPVGLENVSIVVVTFS